MGLSYSLNLPPVRALVAMDQTALLDERVAAEGAIVLMAVGDHAGSSALVRFHLDVAAESHLGC